MKQAGINMKAKNFRKKLNENYTEKPKKVNKNFKGDKEDDLKIIGITGSRGKSSVAYLLNEYLKKCGYKTVLYSSIAIDSPLSFYSHNEAIEVSIDSEEKLLNAVGEALDYEADYLILEINESTLSKGIINNLSFDMRVLTNIIPKQNDIIYNDYVEIKKSFFKKASKKEKLVIGLVDQDTVDLYNEMKEYDFITYTTKFLSNRYLVKQNKIDYLLVPNEKYLDSINGLRFSVYNKKQNVDIETKLIFKYNIFNILCLYSIINGLDAYDESKFKELIFNPIIPGREDIINTNDNKIMISVNLVPHLEYLKEMKKRGEIENIILVTGAAGAGYVDWHKDIPIEKYMEDKILSIKFAYNYINQNVDSLFITLSDNGTINEEEWLNYQLNLVDKNITTIVDKNRKEAIKKAILSAKKNDFVFISGRGNRSVLCDGVSHISIFNDKEEVVKILNEINKGGTK